MKKLRTLGWGILILLIIIQFFQIDKTSETEVAALTFEQVEQPPAKVLTLMENACFDCHSYRTEFPWYASIQPVGWWLRSHVRGARMNMNFSTWGDNTTEERADLLKESASEIKDVTMPPKSFKSMHPEANLTDEERDVLAAWLQQAAR